MSTRRQESWTGFTRRQRLRLVLVSVLLGTVLIVTGVASAKKDGPSLTPREALGKELFFARISDPASMSCATCHGPDAGWAGPIAGINLQGAVYRGAVPQRFGNRKPPTVAYATFSPLLHVDDDGNFVGGNFWDGRATGEALGNPAADQARGPFLNPVEQNNASPAVVCGVVARSSTLAALFENAWGEPIRCDSEHAAASYDRIALSIAAYKASSEVSPFSSKFDYYLRGEATLTEQETLGLQLFNGKGMCAACHPGDGSAPLFTDFTYDNLGVPRNPENPFYGMDDVLLPGGGAINPEGAAWIDPGLGGFLATRPDWAHLAAENYGKHKVPTLRNVDARVGAGFTKAFMHNGVLKSLEEVVHFYNTRDVESWPEPEVAVNVNTDELGDLGLTAEEEAAIVAFLRTLTDGFRP